MIRILFFIESLSAGGAEKVLVTLLKNIDYSRYDVTLMPLVDIGVLREDLDLSKLNYTPVIREENSTWHRIWNKMKYKLIYHYLPCKWVNRWIIPQKGIDTYIAFTEGFPTKLLSYSNKKKIAWVHADLKTDPWTLHSHIFNDFEEEKKAYQQFDRVICVSKSVEQVMKEYYDLDRTITIYNPIDTDDILRKAQESVDINISSSYNIVSVGRLVPQKGYDRLIHIIGKLRREGVNVQLYIIGEGVERKHLENLIQQEKIQDIVHLLGFMKNPYALMAKMDLFVCSSIAEGFSLAIAEAMILGLPIISTKCAGPSEILDGGKYGELVNNDEKGLYEGVRNFINNSELPYDLKNKSAIRRSCFGVQKICKLFDNLVVLNNK